MPHASPACPPPRARRGRAALAALSVAAVGLAGGCELSGRGLPAFGPTPLPHGDAPAAQLERGRELLAQYQCGSCHAIPKVPAARASLAPPLDAFGRRSYIAGHLPNRPETLARWIEAPAALVPGTAMPSMGVSPRDARDMAAYLLALE